MDTTFGKWIEANQALIDCQAKFSKAQIDAMSASEQAQICQKEAQTVSQFLKTDSVSIRHLIEERLKNMH